MLKHLTTALFVLLLSFAAFATDYEDAWDAINKKDYKEARVLLQKAIKHPATSFDAYLTLTLLQTYEGKENNIPGLIERLTESRDKNSYLYSLWFNGAVLGEYNKKQPYQHQLLNKIISDNSFNGSLQTAARYVKALHHVFSNE